MTRTTGAFAPLAQGDGDVLPAHRSTYPSIPTFYRGIETQFVEINVDPEVARAHLPEPLEVDPAGGAVVCSLKIGLSRISAGVAADPEERVNAARLMIPLCWFDAERCALGLERLRAYRKRWSRTNRSYAGPLHDQASHGADAFGEFALNRNGGGSGRVDAERRVAVRQMGGALSWMG